MNNIINALNDELLEINKLISICERKLKTPISDRIQVSSSHKNYDQYFHIYTNENGEQTRRLLKKNELSKASSIIQYNYYENMLSQLISQQRILTNFLEKYNPNTPVDVYDSLCRGRKKLVTPLVKPIDIYVNDWLEAHPGEQDNIHDKGTHETNRKELVKSKSEKILADYFDKQGLIYRYETKLLLPNGVFLFPDFVLLNKRTRETFYWEHLGLLGDMNYASRNWKKMGDYESLGIYVGKNLIYSYEHTKDKLDMRLVAQKVHMYLT